MTLVEQDCREIVCLLESSIWKLVGGIDQQVIDTRGPRPNLRDAIEDVVFNPNNNANDETTNELQEEDLQEFLQETTELMESLEVDDLPLDDMSVLYTRPESSIYTIPDITSQILGVSNTPLRYSRDMEKHIYYQFCPKDENENT